MDQSEFDKIFSKLEDQTRRVLIEKAKEYATGGDRMHNFKVAAVLNDSTPEQALWGFFTKHLVSLMDMVSSGDPYPQALWDEKIGDSINYLYLLRALVEETKSSIPTVLPNAAGGIGIMHNTVVNINNPGTAGNKE